MRQIIMALTLMLTTSMLSACNTVNGVGKDVEKGGEKLQDVAKSNR